MEFMSNKLLTFVLVVVLGISPLQTISASMTKCMDMNKSMMHQQMNKSADTTQKEMAQSDEKSDCCKNNACMSSQCATSLTAITDENTDTSINYKVSTNFQKPDFSLTPYFPSSLYRPPRV